MIFSRENPTFVFGGVFQWRIWMVAPARESLEANASYEENTAAALEF